MKWLNWVKSRSGRWLHLDSVRLSDHPYPGVYIIWDYDDATFGRAFRVGKASSICARLWRHRAVFKRRGLLVTWAYVDGDNIRQGIEKYISLEMNPTVGWRFPSVRPIAVNLPRIQRVDASYDWYKPWMADTFDTSRNAKRRWTFAGISN